ncbi:Hypothetical predicted protein [Octopus vulgaris]|uniref:Uncharacterized protein n=1 Tax=Octopus vulgaris TaxID=6645 RepID=A0AA36BME1_OCTVU|nr:Hypothetical predicted protein [Octopus vulgaris]
MPKDFKCKQISVEIENEPAKKVKMDKENASHFVIEDTKQALLEKTPDEMLMEVTSEEHVENSEIRGFEPSVTGKGPSTENDLLRNHSNTNTLKDNDSLQLITLASQIVSKVNLNRYEDEG